jgi:hypothetical protein
VVELEEGAAVLWVALGMAEEAAPTASSLATMADGVGLRPEQGGNGLIGKERRGRPGLAVRRPRPREPARTATYPRPARPDGHGRQRTGGPWDDAYGRHGHEAFPAFKTSGGESRPREGAGGLGNVRRWDRTPRRRWCAVARRGVRAGARLRPIFIRCAPVRTRFSPKF